VTLLRRHGSDYDGRNARAEIEVHTNAVGSHIARIVRAVAHGEAKGVIGACVPFSDGVERALGA
jgi:hypothetical protein